MLSLFLEVSNTHWFKTCSDVKSLCSTDSEHSNIQISSCGLDDGIRWLDTRKTFEGL